MSQPELVKTVLTAVFPRQCRAVGPSALDDLVTGEMTIEQPEEGRPFPMMELFELLKDAAQFTAAAFAIYLAIKQMKARGQKPTLTELKDEVTKANTNKGRLSDDQATKVLEEIQGHG